MDKAHCDEMFTTKRFNYPSIQNAFYAWNNLVSHVDFSADGVGVNTNMFANSQSMMFADGAPIGVVANPAYLKFYIV